MGQDGTPAEPSNDSGTAKVRDRGRRGILVGCEAGQVDFESPPCYPVLSYLFCVTGVRENPWGPLFKIIFWKTLKVLPGLT